MKFLIQTILLIAELLVFAATSYGAKGVTEVHSFGSDTRPEGGGTVVCVGTNEAGCIFFLTAKHITHGAASYKVKLGDKWVKANLIKAHDTLDIAMLGTSAGIAIDGLQWPDVAEELPEIGTPIKMAGYGGPMFGGTPIERQGQVKEYVLIRERRENGGSWQKFRSTDVGPVIDAGVYSGDSGGGYFDENDNLLGIISAFVNDKIDNKRLVAVSCVEIRKWYEECQWSCPPCRNGRCPPQRQQQFQRQPPIIVSPPVQVSPPPTTPPLVVDIDKRLDPLRGQINALRESLEVFRLEVEDLKDRPANRPSTQELDTLRHEIVILRGRIAKLEARPTPTDGRDGNGVSRLWLEGNELWVELSNGTKESLGTFTIPGDSADVDARLAQIEAEIRKPFRVQLYDTGKPVSEIQEVNPHGGYLSLDLFGEVIKAKTSPQSQGD